MKFSIAGALLFGSLWVAGGVAMAAKGEHDEKALKQDAARHKAMSQAHEAAARCLESGRKADQCYKELQAACKGLAIGKYCGMKHEH